MHTNNVVRRAPRRSAQRAGGIDLEKLADLIAKRLAEITSPAVMDTAEAAKYLRFSVEWMRLRRKIGDGPRFAKTRHGIRYTKRALDDWLEERQRTNTARGHA